jgi:holo-[acyl-carrier protein] synthase
MPNPGLEFRSLLKRQRTPAVRAVERTAARQRSDAMVIGLGTDLIEIGRIADSVDRFGERFLQRVYTAREIAYCKGKKRFAESLAGRFAAKEAGAKALGTGIGRGVGWRDLEVVREPSGRPVLRLHARAAEIADGLGVATISLSLTHGKEIALAVVVMETG